MQSQLISRLTGIFEFLNKYNKSTPSPVSVASAEANAGVASTIVKSVANVVGNSVAISPVEEKNTGKNSSIVAVEPLVKEIVTAIATTISQASKTSADAQTANTTLPIGTPSSASSPLGITSHSSNSPEREISAQIAPTIVTAVKNAIASSPLQNDLSTSIAISTPSTKSMQVSPTSLTTNLENKLKYVFTYLEKYRKPPIGAPVVTDPKRIAGQDSGQDSTILSHIKSMQTLASTSSTVTGATVTGATVTGATVTGATVPVATVTGATVTGATVPVATVPVAEQKPHSIEPLSFTGVTTILVGEKDNKPTQTINTYDFSKK